MNDPRPREFERAHLPVLRKICELFGRTDEFRFNAFNGQGHVAGDAYCLRLKSGDADARGLWVGARRDGIRRHCICGH